MTYFMTYKGDRYIVHTPPEKSEKMKNASKGGILVPRKEPAEKHTLECTLCGAEVERENKKLKKVSCFNCKMERIKKRAVIQSQRREKL